MGLDIWQICPCCKESHDDGRNYTYNVSKMWYEAMPGSKQFVDIDGMTGDDSIPVLQTAITRLKADPDKYQAMNPENGYGTYTGFVEFLEELKKMAVENPNRIWQSWR